MTEKERIIDMLADDFEDITQIHYSLGTTGEEIPMEKVQKCLSDMLDEGLIYVEREWNNSLWYGMTEKGKEFWNQIECLDD